MAFKMKRPSMMKKLDDPKLKKADPKPTASEIAVIKAHNQAMKDNPELYKDAFYDSRKEKVKNIKKKYPNYKF
tara:strand:+ start:323 stop:541 length:219 start_codon:yes stop_codon:yes gene_type:complete